MPSGDSTPRARGFDRRWWRSCSLTMGGPSRRRFTEYQKLSSSSSPPRPRRPTALRMATSVRPVDRKSLWPSYHRQAVSRPRGGAGDMTVWHRGPVRAGAGGSGDELVGRVDHDHAGILDPDPAAEQDLAPGLDAR